VEQLGHDVDLGSVARRENDCFSDVVTLGEPGDRLAEHIGSDRDAFEQRERSAAVIDSDDQDRHAAPTLRRRTTSRLAGDGAQAGRRGGTCPALFVVAEDLQFDGEVDLANTDAVRYPDDRRREVEQTGDTCRNERVGGGLRGGPGSGDDADGDVAGLDDLRKFSRSCKRS
jgi:hypothetical protein